MTDPASPSVVRTRGVSRTFGSVRALVDVDLDVPPGVTGLVGPNGAGKSTLMSILLGLDHADTGTVEVLGIDAAAAGPDVRMRVGYAPEFDPMPPDVRAQDLVRLIARLHGLDHRVAMERSSDVLQRLGLGEERLRPVGTLSTGQKQRVKLAQAIVHDPALVLLDEPTDGLDPLQRADMLDLIVSLADELSLNVLVSSHLLPDLERICGHLVVMRDGRVVAQQAVGEHADLGAWALEVVRDDQVVARHLRAAGLTVEVTLTDGATTLVVAGDESVLPTLRDTVDHTGAGLRSLTRRRSTLEDVVVGGGGR